MVEKITILGGGKEEENVALVFKTHTKKI